MRERITSFFKREDVRDEIFGFLLCLAFVVLIFGAAIYRLDH